MKKVSDLSTKTVVLVMAIFVLLAMVTGIAFAGRTAYADSNKTVETRVVHMSDSHVMPMAYCNTYSTAFSQASVTAAKLMSESEAALQTALMELYKAEKAPTIMLLSGDITSNGELAANKRVAEILKEFTRKMRTRAGYEKFQIFVVPGNHDTYNDGAVTYMPTEEELDECENEEERLELLTNYAKKSAVTTTSKDIFEIYSDFGYCNCPGRKAGHHEATCGMAEGTVVNFFYESEYWYDNTTTRTISGGETVYNGFDTMVPTDEAIAAFKDNGKDFEYLAEAGRIGACSYVATLDGVTVIGVDGNAREYVGVPEKTHKAYAALASGSGWNETTGGLTTRAQLRWIVDETKEEVANGNLMLLNCHYNNIPHFDAQDEVISLFVLDNYEQYNRTLSDAGIHYSFSGHQHAFDVTDYVTQNGNVFYDFETGSLISYGSGYRIVDFKQVWENGAYYEDVKSSVHQLDYNADDAFYYGAYKLTSELTTEDVVATTDYVDPTIFEDAENVHLYPGDGKYLTLVKKTLQDGEGNAIGLGQHLTHFLANQLTGLIGNFVNDGLYDMLRGLTAGLKPNHGYLYGLVGSLIDGLSAMDLPELKLVSRKEFYVTDDAVKGNDLVDVAKNLVEYLFNYDFSYGKIAGGVTLTDLFVELYGGHLAGVETNGPSATVQPLMEKLNDGTFVDFLVNLLVNSIIPELDFLFDAPIRFNASTPALPEGVGFDVSKTIGGSASGLDIVIRGLIQQYGMKNPDKNGYSSLKIIVGNVASIAEDLLIKDVKDIEDGLLSTFANPIRVLMQGMLSSIEKYVYLAIDYINEYEEDGKIYNVLQKELLDKYVTDAFCRNLGNYAAYIIGSICTDDTPDGGRWTDEDKMVVFAVTQAENFNVTTRKYDSSSVLAGKAFRRAKNAGVSGDKLSVTPTEENGLLPGMISLSFNADPATDKKIRWTTSIDRSVFDKNASGAYEFSTPDSFVEYSVNKDMSGAKKVKATTVNVDQELPTIDLGIFYFNMSHRYRLYNDHTVTLTDLQPGTTYYYRLGNDEYAWTDVYSFTTANEGAFSFMAITDIQGSVEANYIDSYPNVKKGVDSFGDREIAFIASMGDNVDNGKSVLQYAWWLDDQKDVWSNNTLVTLAGNHEKKEYALSKRIALPDDATVNATGYYYSYDYNYAHFIILDTNDLTGENELSKAQTEWLLADLEKNAENKDTKWTIVMLHKGPYTAGSHAFDKDVIGLRKQLTPIFAENGVDLVLQGHDHTYSVSEYVGADGKAVEVKTDANGAVVKPQGVLYLNLGTMGDKYYNYLYSDEVSLVKRTSVDSKLAKYLTDEGYLELTETPVFADITVDKGALSIKTYTIVDGETVLVDDIAIRKSAEVDWSNLTPSQIALIAAVVAGVVVIVVLIALCISARKKKSQWTK